jgi:hypothetical protein
MHDVMMHAASRARHESKGFTVSAYSSCSLQPRVVCVASRRRHSLTCAGLMMRIEVSEYLLEDDSLHVAVTRRMRSHEHMHRRSTLRRT